MRPGLTYEVAFETKNPPVAGLGLAAIRDMASALKYDPRADRARALRLHVRLVADRPLHPPDSSTKASPSTSRGGRRSTPRSCRPARPASAASTSGSRSRTSSARSRQTQVPVPLQDDDRSDHRPAGRPGRADSRRPRAEDDAGGLGVGVLGSRPRGGAASHLARRPRGRRGRAERARLSAGRHAARRRQLSARRQRRAVQGEHQRLPLGAARPAGRARRLGPAGHRAARQPPSEAGGRDAGRARRSEVSGHSRA